MRPVASADGRGAEAMGVDCGSGWCGECAGAAIREVADRAIRRIGESVGDGAGYFLTVTPPAPVVTREAFAEFLGDVQRFLRALARPDRDTVLDGGVWVAEWVSKRDREPTVESCPVCADVVETTNEAGEVIARGPRMSEFWRDDAGACVVCDGAGFLPPGHLHVHVVAVARRPFWWGRVGLDEVRGVAECFAAWEGPVRAGEPLPCHQLGWLVTPEGAAARAVRGRRGGPPVEVHEVVGRHRRWAVLALAADRARREQWAVVPGGGGLWALAESYGLGRVDVQVIGDLGQGEDARALARYLGKVVSYVSKSTSKRGDAAAFKAWLGRSRRVAAFGTAAKKGEGESREVATEHGVGAPVATHRRVWVRGAARLQRSGLAPAERLAAVRVPLATASDPGVYVSEGERWLVSAPAPLASLETTKSPKGRLPPGGPTQSGGAPKARAPLAGWLPGAAWAVRFAARAVTPAWWATGAGDRYGTPAVGAGCCAVTAERESGAVALRVLVVRPDGVPLVVVTDGGASLVSVAALLLASMGYPAERALADVRTIAATYGIGVRRRPLTVRKGVRSLRVGPSRTTER